MLRARSGAEPSGPQDEDELDLDSLSVEDLRSPGAARRRQAVRSARADDTRGRSRILPVLVAGVALVCVAAGIFFAYSWFFAGGKGGNVPVVQALDDPVKVKPASPGGLEVPYQDQLVLNQQGARAGEQPVVERLLPPPETPQPPPSEPEPLIAAQARPGTPATGEIAAAAAAPLKGDGIVEAPVPDRNEIIEVPPPPSAAAPAQPAPAQPATTQPAPAQPAPAQPAPAQVAQATGKAPAKGSYLVQLGSFTTTKGTRNAWVKLKKAHPELLGDMSLFIQEATVNDRAYYRVQAGPVPNRATALDMCAQLKAKNQDCLVVRR
jgi:cell division septation protein DedD